MTSKDKNRGEGLCAIRRLRKSYGTDLVLDGIDAEFAPSSVTAILGPSGCGKTTLLNIIAGLVKPDSGVVMGFNTRTFSYSFQEPRLLPWLNCRQNIEFAMAGIPSEERDSRRAERFLELAGLGGCASSKPSALSGGMKRRLSLARAFAYPSDVLLLDEAFSAVDLKLRIELMDLFSALWRQERRTAIFVTHEIRDALYLADAILVFSAKPATVLDRVNLDTPREERSFGSEEFMKEEARLYSTILG